MTSRAHRLLRPWIAALGVLAGGGAAKAGETVTFDAFSVWQAEARTFRTGAETGTVVGVLRGALYVETAEGPTRTGSIACPMTIEVSLRDARQQGSGRCTITAPDGALAFGTVVCSGYHLVGCTGEFRIEGGTGRLKGVSGSGPVTLRGDRWVLAGQSDSEVSQAATGIAFWRGFELTTP